MKNDIEFTTNNPDLNFLKEFEIVSLLGNIFNNAIDVSSKADAKRIKLYTQKNEENIVIKMNNTIVEKKDNIKSTK